jgi:hypothetical protein
MQKVNLVLIAGAKASGKGLIRGVLDGHPELFVSPFHELIMQSFSRDGYDQNALKHKDIQYVREILANKSKYYQLERFALNKKLNVHIGSKQEDILIDLNFNFYDFDRSWVSLLLSNDSEWTPKLILILIYQQFSRYLLNSKTHKKYYCALSDGFPGELKKFINIFPNEKIIYIKRNPLEIIASLVERKWKNDYRSHRFSRESLFKKYGNSDFVKSILLLDEEANELERQYPNQILNLDFNKIFQKKDELKNQLIDFLKISHSDLLNIFSSMGINMMSYNSSSSDLQQVDKGYGDLTALEINKLKNYLNQ